MAPSKPKKAARELVKQLLADEPPLDPADIEMQELADGEELPPGPKICRLALLAGKTVKSPEEASRLAVLQFAVKEGRPKLVKKLLATGIDPNRKLFGETLLNLALDSRDRGARLETVQVLLNAGADPQASKYPPLDAAVSSLDIELTRLFIARGESVSAKGDWRVGYLAQQGALELLELLLAHGAAVNARGEMAISDRELAQGVTPLMAAAFAGQLETAKALLRAGADTTLADRKQHTALDYARKGAKKKNITAMLKLLESAGTTPGNAAQPLETDPPLTKAARTKGFREIVAEIEKLTKTKAEPLYKGPGGKGFAMSKKQALEFARKYQQAYLDRGALVVHSNDIVLTSSDCLIALPTTDMFAAVEAIGTDGGSDYDNQRVLKGLRELHACQPFRLVGIGSHFIEGDFHNPVSNVRQLATLMAEFCPDIVSQGAGTKQKLTSLLKSEQCFFLWWD